MRNKIILEIPSNLVGNFLINGCAKFHVYKRLVVLS